MFVVVLALLAVAVFGKIPSLSHADDISQYVIVDASSTPQTIQMTVPLLDLNGAPYLSMSSQSSSTRSLNTAFQVSTTSPAQATYTVDIASALSLSGGQSGTVVLEIASNSGFTTNVQTLSQFTNANAGTLTIGLNITQTNTAVLTGFIPTGYFVRLRTVNNTGSPTFTYKAGQEVVL